MKKKYKYEIVGTVTRDNNRPLYRISTIKNNKVIEKVIGLGALRTMHIDGAICGYIPEYIKSKLGVERRKTRSDKKGYTTENKIEQVAPKVERTIREPPIEHQIVEQPISHWIQNKAEIIKPRWRLLPDEFNADPLKTEPKINIKSYCYVDDNKRWHVIMTDGIEDEDTYPTEKWALQMVDMYNNPSDEDEESS